MASRTFYIPSMPILLLASFLLASCSDNLMYDEPKPRLSIEAAFYAKGDPNKILRLSDTLLAGDSAQFMARIEPSPEFAKNYFWLIESPAAGAQPKRNARLEFPHWMDSAIGQHIFTFCAIDNMGDTLAKRLSIAVSSKLACVGELNLSVFQGSPTFSWECADENPAEILSYNLSIRNRNGALLLDTFLLDTIAQWGKALPLNFEAKLIASNSYGFKDSLELKAAR